LTTVVRFKIIDLYRRERLAARVLESEQGRLQPSDPIAAIEARAALRLVEDAEPLRWALREAEGEPLAQIAAEQALPAPVVRQRVSRFRRRLRETMLLAAAMGILVLVYFCRPKAEAIGPDRHDMPALTTATWDGSYVIVGVDGVAEGVQARVLGTEVGVSNGVVRLAQTSTRLVLQSNGTGQFSGTFGAVPVQGTIANEVDRVVLESRSGAFQGRITLRRK
jgi:hypothetical protein